MAKNLLNSLTLLTLGLAILPLAALCFLAFSEPSSSLSHLWGTVLPRATKTTLFLMAVVAAVTISIGVITAWLTTMCRFPGRQVLAVCLLLPLAVPTYVSAYAWLEVLDYSGPVQEMVRSVLGVSSARDYWFPAYRTTFGAGLFLGLVLYPYVYLTCRLAFATQSAEAAEVARTLGSGPARVFWRITLPLARPAIVAGVSLALMETLNDIGAVEFFGVQSLTLSVYSTWLNRGDLAGATQLALIILSIVISLLGAERWARGKQRYAGTGKKTRSNPAFTLKGAKACLAFIACFLPVFLGFIVPSLQLGAAALRRFPDNVDSAFLNQLLNSLELAAIASLVTVALATVFAYLRWKNPYGLRARLVRFGSVGYAVPGTVLAIGILIPLASFDNALDGQMRQWFGISTGLLLSGSFVALIYAYSVRFLAVGSGAMETGFSRLSLNIHMASRSLGVSPQATFVKIELPLLRSALATAGLLVFVDVMKELPATLLLRPFNFETLATEVYAQASLGLFEDGALAALTIVAVGILPVLQLSFTAASGLVQHNQPKYRFWKKR